MEGPQGGRQQAYARQGLGGYGWAPGGHIRHRGLRRAGDSSKAAKRAELVRIGEARRKAAAAESKRKYIESQVYTPEQVALFSERVGLVVQKYLPEELYIDFYNDFARLIGSREINLDDPDGGDFSDEAPD